MTTTIVPATPLLAARSDAAGASLLELPSGRRVSRFHIAGGKHRGAITEAGGEAATRAVRMATDLGIPLVGHLDTSGADIVEGVPALHAWGCLARALCEASGVVPTILVVDGPCLSGPALLLGLADAVIMTDAAFAYVSGPPAVAAFTGEAVTHDDLGGARVHAAETGVATLHVAEVSDASDAVDDLLRFLPDNHLDEAPRTPVGDPPERSCDRAAATVPLRASAGYDVRDVIHDVVDLELFLELSPRWAQNMVVGLGSIDGRSVGVVANQPCVRAGSIDIDASRKAARFVQWCDAFGLPVVTFVDTPGYEPGKTLEWRGMIRHGASLVHAYAAATVPRVCVVLRKAYGGAYIVMDSKTLGNDWCAAWPTAEIAVMGAPGAVQILHRRELDAIEEPRERERVAAERAVTYEERFATPTEAAARGYVDAVIEPRETRALVARVLARLETKREAPAARKHSNVPL